MTTEDEIKAQTKKWITDVVIGCNFCPFAAKEVKQNTIHYQVETSTQFKECLDALLLECQRLDKDPKIQTTLLILPNVFPLFDDYLDLLGVAETLLVKKGYEGIYQLASFHPEYCFADSAYNDAANYTNRSPYPMLHLLREEQIEQALLHYENPEKIPQRNMDFARKKGEVYMKMLRDACL
ncbi:MAG: hypothetical protein JWO06_3724 [Bacteroidota bacterium]|nr:hypothetical protein [Bacteroidota bacterium]